jgi:hypothetical protein
MNYHVVVEARVGKLDKVLYCLGVHVSVQRVLDIVRYIIEINGDFCAGVRRFDIASRKARGKRNHRRKRARQ